MKKKYLSGLLLFCLLTILLIHASCSRKNYNPNYNDTEMPRQPHEEPGRTDKDSNEEKEDEPRDYMNEDF